MTATVYEKKSYKNANPDWKTAAINAVKALAMTLDQFSTDDVRDLLDKEACRTHDLRAIGPIMRLCASQGLIKANGFIQSVRSQGRQRIVLWQSVALK